MWPYIIKGLIKNEMQVTWVSLINYAVLILATVAQQILAVLNGTQGNYLPSNNLTEKATGIL